MKIESIRRRTAILLVLGVASIFALGASIFVLGVSILPGAYAVEQFTNKTIEGTWGVSGSGTMTDFGSIVFVGLFTFDGNGSCSVKEDFNSPLVFVNNITSIACTYKVSPDGTGTATPIFLNISFGEGPLLSLTSTYSFVIADKEDEIQAITTDQNFIARTFFRRQ